MTPSRSKALLDNIEDRKLAISDVIALLNVLLASDEAAELLNVVVPEDKWSVLNCESAPTRYRYFE